MKYNRLYILIGSLSILMVIVTSFVVLNMNGAQQIPSGAYFNKVKQLSSGKKPSCLTKNKQTDDFVAANDKLSYSDMYSSPVTSAIPDMPAGKVTINVASASQTNATGSIIFTDPNQAKTVGKLNSFNFAVHRTTNQSGWMLASYIACSK